MPFRSFHCSLISGELLTGGVERFTLCVVASTLMAFKAGNPQVVIQIVIRIPAAFFLAFCKEVLIRRPRLFFSFYVVLILSHIPPPLSVKFEHGFKLFSV